MTNLYLINSNADEDFSLSLFVEALDSDQARELWRKHCHDNEWPRPAESTITIFRVPPLSGKARAIDWNDVDQRITGA